MQGVETCSTDHAILPEPILAALPTSGTTTLYDVIAALQEVVEPGEDALVVAIVDVWLRSGRIRFVDEATIAAQGGNTHGYCRGRRNAGRIRRSEGGFRP